MKALKLASEAITDCPQLWHNFFSDFIICRLDVGISKDVLTKEILDAFYKQFPNDCALKKMIVLHTSYQDDVLKIVVKLRLLDQIKMVI